MGLQGSAYPVDVDVKIPGQGITAGVTILNNKINVTKEQLQGLSGLYRVYFGMTTAAADYQLELQRSRLGGQFGVGATAEAFITNGEVSDIVVKTSGNNYPIGVGTAPNISTTVAITGGGGAGATATAVIERGEIVRIDITAPGSGFTSIPLVTITSPAFVAQVMKFNGDNSFLLKSGGYYRFDIGVRPGDILDFIPAVTNIVSVLEFRMDQIQIGA